MLQEQICKGEGPGGNEDRFNTIGGRICTGRETIGLSTAQLARRLGVKTSTLAGWETDRAEPRSNKLVMLAALLNVSPTWLLTGVGESPSMTADPTELETLRASVGELREQALQLADRLDQLSERIGSYSSFSSE